MHKILILSFFIFTLLNDISFADAKGEIKILNKLYCKDIKEKRIPKLGGMGLFFNGTEVEITKYTFYFYKNSFYRLINRYEKKERYVELDMTSSPHLEFYTELNYYDNELNYTFYAVWPDRILSRDGKKIQEYYKRSDLTGLFIIKLNKQTLNGSYEFKSPFKPAYKDTSGEFKCEISSRKI